jgi:hypothetical protein
MELLRRGDAVKKLETFANPEKEVRHSATTEPHEVAPEDREERAAQLVDRFAMWSAAGGLIPLPGIDVLTVGVCKFRCYTVFLRSTASPSPPIGVKALIMSLAGSAIPATSALGAASMVKFVPIIGTVVSGFAMPAFSAGAAYAIGKAFIQHLKSGGTLLDLQPPKYREFIQAQKAKWESRRTDSASKARASGTADSAAGATTPANL